MSFKGIVGGISSFVRKNKTTILAVTGVAELITAGILAFKERPEVDEVLADTREELDLEEDAPLKITEAFIPVMKVMWPSITLAAIGAGSIIFGNHISVASNAASLAAYKISERATENLTDAVVKTVGDKKAGEIFDNAAKEAVRDGDGAIHVDDEDIIPTRGGHYIFWDVQSGLKFYSSSTFIEAAVNRVNNRINQAEAVSVGEFLEELDIPREKIGKTFYKQGWYLGYSGLLEHRLTSVMDDQDRPVGVITYNVDPRFWNS